MGTLGTISKRRKTLVLAGVAAAAAAGVTAAVLPAVADNGEREGSGHAAHGVQSLDARGSLSGGRGGALFAAGLSGAAEVPVKGGPAVGDKDGAALEFIKVKGDRVSVAVKWRGTAKPTMLHIHEGAKGTNGGVKVDFTGLLGRIRNHQVTGSVTVKDRALLGRLTKNPGGFYANLHTAEFPGGAVRGRLHKVSTDFAFRDALSHAQASVVRGRQIYQCRKADDGSGTYAFAQRDVRAVLGGNIVHNFTAPNSGTPQWIAPDRSAVTGKLISKTPNGDGNIPELDLRATQTGKRHGLLSGTAEILRLNTVGGVAPAGSCDPGTVVGVPYRADYVFVQR
ncbi:CHRD domain-containing protein [Streptomyces sp. NBC_01361]|uniref:CHRD domain-containing protein n=1 Tax=Streptomyces sp. NBC_01361 TaxID=2903838 RepID=UPI002E30D515|nr:CHRD domain-containing protein [Streptomyces sp. NBC_01361]